MEWVVVFVYLCFFDFDFMYCVYEVFFDFVVFGFYVFVVFDYLGVVVCGVDEICDVM